MYLTFFARDKNVAPSTQNQALNALVFLYKHVNGAWHNEISIGTFETGTVSYITFKFLWN